MASWVCVNDLVAYAVGMKACPQCGVTEHVEEYSPEHEALLAGEAPAVAGLEGDDVPSGSVDEVLAWVGDDSVRARRALIVEQGRDKPRKSLVEQLAEVAK